MDIDHEEIINTRDILTKEENIVQEANIITIDNKENIDNINSPQLIQDILHLSTNSTKNGFQIQNNMIKSLYSFNNSILSIFDSNLNDFNPDIYFLQKKHKLHSMDFNKNNIRNNFLQNKIEQYNDLKQKISQYKNNINNNEINNDKDNIIKTQKLFFINHPLINLFKEEIDINEIKKEIKEEYNNKMKDNTGHKPAEIIPHHGINIIQDILHHQEEEEEDEEESEGMISVNNDNEEEDDELYQPLHEEGNNNNNNEVQNNNENENINNNNEQPPQHINLPEQDNHNDILINLEPNNIVPDHPLPIIEPIVPLEQIPPIEPIEPIEPIHPIEPLPPIPHPIIDIPHPLNIQEPNNNDVIDIVVPENIHNVDHNYEQNDNGVENNNNQHIVNNEQNNESMSDSYKSIPSDEDDDINDV